MLFLLSTLSVRVRGCPQPGTHGAGPPASPVLTQRGELELGRGPWRREGGLAGPRRPEQQKIESPQLFKSVTYCP